MWKRLCLVFSLLSVSSALPAVQIPLGGTTDPRSVEGGHRILVTGASGYM